MIANKSTRAIYAFLESKEYKAKLRNFAQKVFEFSEEHFQFIPPGTPNELHRMFNLMFRALFSFLAQLALPRKTEYREMISVIDQLAVKKPTLLVTFWKSRMKADTMQRASLTSFYSSTDKTKYPRNDIFDSIMSEEEWFTISEDDRFKVWEKLYHLQSTIEVLEVIPEEIILGVEEVVLSMEFSTPENFLRMLIDKILENDLILQGTKRLISDINPRLMIAPTYHKKLNLIQNL